MSVNKSDSDDSTVVECPDCGYEVDPRGLSNHRNGVRCKYRESQQEREERGYTVDLSHANGKIRNWLDKHTEDGAEQFYSRYQLGGYSWNPELGEKYYTTPQAWETFLRQNRLTNPQEQADEKVKIAEITEDTITVEIEIDGDVEHVGYENEEGIENRRKAYVRDDVIYNVEGDRIGVKPAF